MSDFPAPALHVAGAAVERANRALLLVHGRGGSAREMLSLGAEVVPAALRAETALLAPQAAAGTWYPNRFIAPVASNEPHLSLALEALAGVVAFLAQAGLPPERLLLAGFSQGACLVLEFVARRPQRYGAVAGLSGGLIENGDLPRHYTGSLAGTPLFLGCSDVDFHIPLERVERSASLLTGLGAKVDKRIYPAMGHTVNADEIAALQKLVMDLGESQTV